MVGFILGLIALAIGIIVGIMLKKFIVTDTITNEDYTKVEVGDAGYDYVTTTGQYVNPNTATTIGDINKPGLDCVTGKVDPSITIYANKLPDDIVDDPYNNIGMSLPDDIKDNCCYESDSYKAWREKWCKEIKDNKPIKCKK